MEYEIYIFYAREKYVFKDLPKKLAICFSSIQSESLVRDLEMDDGKITMIKNM